MNPWIAFVLTIAALIVVHEAGHFIVAKLSGITVEEFSLGFGPRIAGFTRRGTLYVWRLLPIGGYVRMAGMDPGSGHSDASAFLNKPLRSRFLTIAAGPMMNFILAVVLFGVVFSGLGVPTPAPGVARVGAVMAGYPAQRAGIRPGDVIVAVDGRQIPDWHALSLAIAGAHGHPVRLTVDRGRRQVHLVLTPRVDPQTHRSIVGVEQPEVLVRSPVPTAVGRGTELTGSIIGGWFGAVASSVERGRAPSFQGPVGIFGLVSQAAQAGFSNLLAFAAVLSINLGVVNLLPIPSLDGSRLVFLGLEWVRRRPVDPNREAMVHMIGFAAVVVLMVVLTFHDLIRMGIV